MTSITNSQTTPVEILARWNEHPLIVGVGLTALFYLVCLAFEVNVCEMLMHSVSSFEHLQLDELLLGTLIVGVFTYRRYSHRRRANIYGATAGAAQHVLGNFLQGLQMVKFIAKDSRDIPPAVLELCDRLTGEATSQLKALSSVQHVNEETIWRAVMPASPGERKD